MLKAREILRLKHEVGLSLRGMRKRATAERRQYRKYSNGLKKLE